MGLQRRYGQGYRPNAQGNRARVHPKHVPQTAHKKRPHVDQWDSTPDLTFVKNVGEVTWRNTGEDLGSDQYILETELKNEGGRKIEHKWTDWDAFRLQRRNDPGQTDIEDIETWTTELRKGIQTNESVACVDNRLAHVIEARKSIKEQ